MKKFISSLIKGDANKNDSAEKEIESIILFGRKTIKVADEFLDGIIGREEAYNKARMLNSSANALSAEEDAVLVAAIGATNWALFGTGNVMVTEFGSGPVLEARNELAEIVGMPMRTNDEIKMAGQECVKVMDEFLDASISHTEAQAKFKEQNKCCTKATRKKFEEDLCISSAVQSINEIMSQNFDTAEIDESSEMTTLLTCRNELANLLGLPQREMKK